MTVLKLKYFKLSEFDSPDLEGSGEYMQVKCLRMLDRAREIAQMPFKITSGFRTQAHQDNLTKRGYETAKNSPHLAGQAADIAYFTEIHLDKIIQACVQVGFTSIGIGKGFVHVDTRPRKAVWFYQKTPQKYKEKYRSLQVFI